MSDLNKAFQYDYFPDSPSEKMDSWKKSKKGECDLFLEKELSMSYRFREAYKNLLRVHNSSHELIGFRSKDEEVEKFVLPYPEYFLFAYPPPIDYEVRFPLPFFLEKLPPYKEAGKIKEGAPLNWGRNLLIYELMQKEIDLEMVCHLMFENKKGVRKEKVHSQKEQVKRMIKRVEISVSNSYPFSSI